MPIERKPDFEKSLQRFEAWWNCEIIDRPPVNLGVKRTKPAPKLPEKKYASFRERWFDFDHQLERMEIQTAQGVYPADNFPMWMGNLGPEICATIFGCELEFSEYSSWSKPICTDIRQVLQLKPDLNNVYWKAIREATKKSIERGRGKWLTGHTDLHTNGDILAAFRDPQNLCLDMIDDPEGAALACQHVTKFYPAMFDDLYNLIAAAGLPSTTWTPTLHQGRSYVSQCDFICMISPDQFRQVILPSLIQENSHLDRIIYHLDGPGALRHLDDLLTKANVNAVQWVYGAGAGPASKWIDVYKRIQAAGKGMQVLCESWEDARTVCEHLRPEGVWLCIGEQFEEEQIPGVLDWITKWAAGKR